MTNAESFELLSEIGSCQKCDLVSNIKAHKLWENGRKKNAT